MASRRWMIRLLSFHPPTWARASASKPPADLRTLEVRMKLRWYGTRNYVGTRFDDSLYSMCDPFFILILVEALGKGYIV